MARNFACRPSELLQIEYDAMAFDFDALCATRLLLFDNAKDRHMQEALLMVATGMPLATGMGMDAQVPAAAVEEW
jgi:hypothetical protein